jgi:hypothetical protein
VTAGFFVAELSHEQPAASARESTNAKVKSRNAKVVAFHFAFSLFVFFVALANATGYKNAEVIFDWQVMTIGLCSLRRFVTPLSLNKQSG